jgi:hypothetical protein
MKKKLTIGVFLALAVVLVASIVGVGVADAGKPDRIITDVTYISNENGTGNVTFTVSWEKKSAWGFEWFFGNITTGETGSWTRIDSGGGPFPEGRTSSDYKVLVAQSNLPCGQDYYGSVHLHKKNGEIMQWGSDSITETAESCPID